MQSDTTSITDTHSIEHLVCQRLGLELGLQERQALRSHLSARTKVKRVSTDQYCRELDREDTSTSAEWQQLVSLLANNESFFFRDSGQFSILRHQILPDILARRERAKSIRIWSAGCSRGEEIFSVAMLLDEIIPDRDQWSFALFGSDIDADALEAARKGVYSNWSFRLVDAHWKEKYFTRTNGGYQLSPMIRGMVKFHHLNLVEDDFPLNSGWVREMDLIICRNVFIYFSPKAISSTLGKFVDTLSDGGFLISGHTELIGHDTTGLRPYLMPGGVFFSKTSPKKNPPVAFSTSSVGTKNVPSRPIPKTNATSPPKPPPQTKGAVRQKASAPLETASHMSRAHDLFSAGKYLEALDSLKKAPKETSSDKIAVLELESQCYLNLGDYEKAKDALTAALKLNEFSSELNYVGAHIHELCGDMEKAILLLERAIYLNGDFVPAQLDLASILETRGREARAKKLRLAALHILERQDSDAPVPPYEGITAGELTQITREIAGMGM